MGIVSHATGHRQQEHRLRISLADFRGIEVRCDGHVQAVLHAAEVADAAIVLKQPFSIAKRVTIGLHNLTSHRCADVSHEQR